MSVGSRLKRGPRCSPLIPSHLLSLEMNLGAGQQGGCSKPRSECRLSSTSVSLSVQVLNSKQHALFRCSWQWG